MKSLSANDRKDGMAEYVVWKLDGELIRKVACFLSIGGGITLAHYVILIFSVRGFGIDPVLASSSGYGVAAVINYYLNSRFTFRYQKSHRAAFLKFLLVALVGFLLNGIIMHICVARLSLHYLMAQVLATVIVLGWNFSANYAWSFR
ncbi:GtrA family protein [Nitrospira moscoviensis]|uniref:GtrA family protein n=1 Tax=Nitrospira moscoviensis TaxID=42253 RepID=A0A0K2GFY7_NITMO|nr:GtrA family protein [Nitrospira moscoviensis]ALA59769.1 GtrA family protein [Nitrospira moscoviensis]